MKLLFAVFSIAILLLLCGCIIEPPRPPGGGTTDLFKGAVFIPIVKGCAESAKASGAGIREMPQLPQDFNEKAATVSFDGNTIVYSRAISHQCCRSVEITKEYYPKPATTEQNASDKIAEPLASGNATAPQMIQIPRITIYENWSGQGCRCICSSEISAKIEGLKGFGYEVKVVERGTTTVGTPMEEKVLFDKMVENGSVETVANLADSIEISGIETLTDTNNPSVSTTEFFVKNNYPLSVFLPGCNEFILEKYQPTGAWIGSLKQCVWEGNAVEINPGKTKKLSFDSSNLDYGTYRIELDVSAGCKKQKPISQANCRENKTVYSKEFSINDSKIKDCNVESDCVLVDAGCCNCNNGGARIAINKNFEQSYKQVLEKNCVEIDCIAVISNDPSCLPGAKATCIGVPPNATCFVQPEVGDQQGI